MLTVAGVGPGNLKYLTEEVKNEILRAKKIFAFGRVGESIKPLREDFIEISKVDKILDVLKEKEDLLLLASGDPTFYGIVDYLKKKNVKIDKILPGLSSFQYMMAKLNLSWHNALLVSLHGRKGDFLTFCNKKLIIVLVDKENTPDYLSQELYKMGMTGTMYIGFNLSYEDEQIIRVNIGDRVENYSNLSVVVIKNEMDC